MKRSKLQPGALSPECPACRLCGLWSLCLLICLLLLVAASVRAIDLNGRVVDQKGNPLAGVSVVTNISGLGTQTDTTGHFALTTPEAVTRVTFSSVGYHSRQFDVNALPATIVLSPTYYRAHDIIVTADRAQEGVTPVPFENFSRDDINRDYTVGEFPVLLESTPNLYAYTDAGSALGYSYLSIRGFNDKRVSVYINGVPLNDPEDQATYFVDLPDFASTVTDIQVQRGVGNSLYGDASFGGSVNIATDAFARGRQATLTTGFGQYYANGKSVGDISKQSIEYASGLIDGRWAFAGRFSKQRTGGYRYNSWYNGWSYYFSLARLDPRMTTELHLYGGPMRMHLAYYGTPRDQLKLDRRTNILNYDNETDNFNQPHYQLHNIYKLNDKATLSNTLYYIRGSGYYEQLKDDQVYSEYDISPSEIDIDPSTGQPYTSGNLVRQQWVQKSQYGWNPRLDIDHANGRHSLGGSFYYFNSDHWGQVVWAQNIRATLDPRHRYYQYFGDKYVASLYGQEQYKLTNRLGMLATAQLRYQRYKFDQDKMGAFKGFTYDVDWLFLSPRLGFTYALTPAVNLLANIAYSSRTPTDAEIYDANDPTILPSLEIKSIDVSEGDTSYVFGDPTAKSEHVVNYELGARYRDNRYGAGVNLFWMDFRNEIIPYGGVNANTGLPITVNANRSVHAGIELNGEAVILPRLTLSSNWAFNYNRVKNYVAGVELDDSSIAVNFADRKISGFPGYLGNIMADYQTRVLRLTWRTRVVGRQWTELYNIKALSIDPYTTSSISAAVSWADFMKLGKLTLTAKVDNLFGTKYETSGYGGNYAYVDSGRTVIDGWAEYFVGPERNFFAQLSLEMF